MIPSATLAENFEFSIEDNDEDLMDVKGKTSSHEENIRIPKNIASQVLLLGEEEKSTN